MAQLPHYQQLHTITYNSAKKISYLKKKYNYMICYRNAWIKILAAKILRVPNFHSDLEDSVLQFSVFESHLDYHSLYMQVYLSTYIMSSPVLFTHRYFYGYSAVFTADIPTDISPNWQ